MSLTPALFPEIIAAINSIIQQNSEAVTELDQSLGDGDHVYNLQRGIEVLQENTVAISVMSWPDAWQKMAQLLMSSVGGASGALYATFLLSLAKHSRDRQLDAVNFADVLLLGVEAVKLRGKADIGEKTMLDVLVPVAKAFKQALIAGKSLPEILPELNQVAETGVEATRDMLATKGRASFLGERSLGIVDAGAKTAQLMISAVIKVILPLV